MEDVSSSTNIVDDLQDELSELLSQFSGFSTIELHASLTPTSEAPPTPSSEDDEHQNQRSDLKSEAQLTPNRSHIQPSRQPQPRNDSHAPRNSRLHPSISPDPGPLPPSAKPPEPTFLDLPIFVDWTITSHPPGVPPPDLSPRTCGRSPHAHEARGRPPARGFTARRTDGGFVAPPPLRRLQRPSSSIPALIQPSSSPLPQHPTMTDQHQMDEAERQNDYGLALRLLEGRYEEEKEVVADSGLNYARHFSNDCLSAREHDDNDEAADTAHELTQFDFLLDAHPPTSHLTVHSPDIRPQTDVHRLLSRSASHMATTHDILHQDACSKQNIATYLATLPSRTSEMSDPLVSRKSRNPHVSEWSFGPLNAHLDPAGVGSPIKSQPLRRSTLPHRDPSASIPRPANTSAPYSSPAAQDARTRFTYAVSHIVARYRSSKAALVSQLERTHSPVIPAEIVKVMTRTAREILELEADEAYWVEEKGQKAVIRDDLELDKVLRELRQARAGRFSGEGSGLDSTPRSETVSSGSVRGGRKGERFSFKEVAKSTLRFFDPEWKRDGGNGGRGSMGSGRWELERWKGGFGRYWRLVKKCQGK